MANYIINNATKFNVGFHRPGGGEVNIQAGKFTALSDEDILFEAQCMTNWLVDGVLTCDDNGVYELLGINRDKAVVAESDEKLDEKFKLNMNKFKAWLDSIESNDAITRVFEAACESDALSVKKAELIEAKAGRKIADWRRLGEEK